MSRIRTVKPELFKHTALFEAEDKYQLPLRIAFIGLFTCCDRQGRFLWQPRRLKVDILPYDNVDITAVLNALLETGFIKAYEVRGIIYGCISTWKKHQYFNNKEPNSELPDINEGKILVPPIQQSALQIHAKFSEEVFTRNLDVKHSESASKQFGSDASHFSEISNEWQEENKDKNLVDTRSSPVFDPLIDAYATREPLKGRERKTIQKRL